MTAMRQAQLLSFLTTELAIPDNALTLALRHSEPTLHTLPMTLFQYGLISLDQLARIFDWLETA